MRPRALQADLCGGDDTSMTKGKLCLVSAALRENAQVECVEHVDAELVNACAGFGAEQLVTAMHHGMLRRPPKAR